VKGYSNAAHRSFRSEQDALLYLHEASDLQIVGASGDNASYRQITTAEQCLKALTLKATSDSSFILLDTNVVTAVFNSPLRANAPAWRPTDQNKENENTNENKTGITTNEALPTNQRTLNCYNESETCQMPSPQNKTIVSGPQDSTALPVLDSTSPRNGGYTFFSDGSDHEVFQAEELNGYHQAAFNDLFANKQIKSQLLSKRKKLSMMESEGDEGKWMYFDSGASRTVINADSPLRSLLKQVTPESGSCTVGSGDQLPYVESGVLSKNSHATVVQVRRGGHSNRGKLAMGRRVEAHKTGGIKIPIRCPILGVRYGIVGIKIAASVEETPFNKTNITTRIDRRRVAQKSVIAVPHLMVKEHEEHSKRSPRDDSEQSPQLAVSHSRAYALEKRSTVRGIVNENIIVQRQGC
jgi:hypothetical protein